MFEKIIKTRVEIPKPWGKEILWAQTDKYVAKILIIEAGECLSLQFHSVKSETLYLFDGQCRLLMGLSREELREIPWQQGESVHIAPGTLHRLYGITRCSLLEVSTPELHDLVRLEDKYGRTASHPVDAQEAST